MDGKIILKLLNFFIVFTIVNIYFVASLHAEQDSYLDSSVSAKRRQNSGLIPFPRVGRGNQRFWKSRLLEQIKRREGLIPFPRVGRSGKQIKRKSFDDESSISWNEPKLYKSIQQMYPNYLEDQWISSILRNYKLAAELNDDDGSILKSNQNNEDYAYPADEGKKENAD